MPRQRKPIPPPSQEKEIVEVPVLSGTNIWSCVRETVQRNNTKLLDIWLPHAFEFNPVVDGEVVVLILSKRHTSHINGIQQPSWSVLAKRPMKNTAYFVKRSNCRLAILSISNCSLCLAVAVVGERCDGGRLLSTNQNRAFHRGTRLWLPVTQPQE